MVCPPVHGIMSVFDPMLQPVSCPAVLTTICWAMPGPHGEATRESVPDPRVYQPSERPSLLLSTSADGFLTRLTISGIGYARFSRTACTCRIVQADAVPP